MNKVTFTILVFAINCVWSCAHAQNPNTNYITQSSYNAITYNGHTIAEINATEGGDIAIQQLFGPYTSVKRFDGDYIEFNFGPNTLGFNYLAEETPGISIEDNSWPVVIKGHTVKVGDTLSDLKQKFSSDLKTINSEYISETVVSFNYNGNGFDGLHIYINPSNQKIVKIKYWTNT